MTDIFERLWRDFEGNKIDPSAGPETRRNYRTAYAAGAFAVEAIMGELELWNLPADLRLPALERLAEAIERFNAETTRAAARR